MLSNKDAARLLGLCRCFTACFFPVLGMRQTWAILFFAFMLIGALIGFTGIATEISYMGRVLFYTALVLLILHLAWRKARPHIRRKRE